MPRIRSRHVLLVTAAAAMFPAMSGAWATPYAGMYRGLDVTVLATTPDQTAYQIEITATQSVAAAVGNEQSLYLDIRRCIGNRCDTIEHSRRPLASGDIAISPDMTSAVLNTTVSGLKIHVTGSWGPVSADGSGIGTPGLDVYSLESLNGGPNPRADWNVGAIGTVALGKLNCGSKPVFVYTYQGVDQTGNDVRDPRHGSVSLPTPLVQRLSRSTCH